ncbi:hypothetical protein H072_1625 [Dactylellina haptotyla CBS 200.50]|uniref:Uncharacterized protein n=1 Tax=Dactylellina haptotyla (strain CBS 200.50) TaxID=1284197 RepID=S8ATV4_DACHA|nr:hypothetical protein H072_1625 [Dactylellina haptotyla CBS 200.50]
MKYETNKTRGSVQKDTKTEEVVAPVDKEICCFCNDGIVADGKCPKCLRSFWDGDEPIQKK